MEYVSQTKHNLCEKKTAAHNSDRCWFTPSKVKDSKRLSAYQNWALRLIQDFLAYGESFSALYLQEMYSVKQLFSTFFIRTYSSVR